MESGKAKLLISVVIPSKEECESSKRPTLIEKVNYAIDCLQGDYNTQRSIAYLAKVYEYICKIPDPNRTPIQHKVMRMIIPELEFFVPHVLQSSDYMQYKQDMDSTDTPIIDPDYMRGR